MSQGLTPTEVRICQLAASGLNSGQMALKLKKSERAVKTAVSKLYFKLGVCSRSELAVLSLYRGFASLPDAGAEIEQRAAMVRRANNEP